MKILKMIIMLLCERWHESQLFRFLIYLGMPLLIGLTIFPDQTEHMFYFIVIEFCKPILINMANDKELAHDIGRGLFTSISFLIIFYFNKKDK